MHQKYRVASADFTLQLCTNPALGDFTLSVPQIVGGQWQMALPLSGNGNAAFYRLSK
jgi:hypothetical protein